MKRKNGTKLGFPEWTQIRCSHSSHCPTEFFHPVRLEKPDVWMHGMFPQFYRCCLISTVQRHSCKTTWTAQRTWGHGINIQLILTSRNKVNSSCWMSQWLIWCTILGWYSIVGHSAQIVMNAEFAVPNCVQYITLAYPDAKERCDCHAETSWNWNKIQCEKTLSSTGFQKVSSLHLPRNKGTENSKTISSWAEHGSIWSILQRETLFRR